MPLLALAMAEDFVEQAPVTSWPTRLLLSAAVIGVIGLALWGMRRNWRRRQQRQAWLELAPAPQGFAPAAQYRGRYVATVRTDDWLDRIAAAGLGFPADATIAVGPAGLLVQRAGSEPLFLPSERLIEATTARGIAQEVYERDGLVAITWQGRSGPPQDADRVTTGLRLQPDDQIALLTAVRSLIGEGR
jgi:hypothetical protein